MEIRVGGWEKIKVNPTIDDDLNCLVNRKSGWKILSRGKVKKKVSQITVVSMLHSNEKSMKES